MRLVQIVVAVLLPVVLSGCLALAVGAAGGVGYYKYRENEVHRDFKASPQETWKVTLRSLERVGYPAPRIKWHQAADGGEIEDDDLWVKVEARANDYTRVRIRVGTFETEENQRKAALLLERIDEAL